jgi:hypothetical protein
VLRKHGIPGTPVLNRHLAEGGNADRPTENRACAGRYQRGAPARGAAIATAASLDSRVFTAPSFSSS